MNWLRIPIPFWAIETWEGEPYLERTAWTCVFPRLVSFLHSLPSGTSSKSSAGRENMVFVFAWISTLYLALRMVGDNVPLALFNWFQATIILDDFRL